MIKKLLVLLVTTMTGASADKLKMFMSYVAVVWVILKFVNIQHVIKNSET